MATVKRPEVVSLLSLLNEQQRRVASLLAQGFTQAEAGDKIGLGQRRVSDILADITSTVKDAQSRGVLIIFESEC